MSSTTSEMPVVLNCITQLTDAGAWTSLTYPLPQGFITLEPISGVLKRGDGVTLYANLPTLLNLNDIVNLGQGIASIQQELTDLLGTNEAYVKKTLAKYAGAGTNQATAMQISTEIAVLVPPSTSTLFILPNWPVGTTVRVINEIGVGITAQLYPDVGSTISGLAQNVAYSQNANSAVDYTRVETTVWLIN